MGDIIELYEMIKELEQRIETLEGMLIQEEEQNEEEHQEENQNLI